MERSDKKYVNTYKMKDSSVNTEKTDTVTLENE